MFRRRNQPGLSRRIVAYYLLFCLIAVTWLAAASIIVAHSIRNDAATSAALIHLGRTSSALEIHLLRRGAEDVDQKLQELSERGQAAYYSLVSLDGRVLAHSTPSLIGTPAQEPRGRRGRWGNCSSIYFSDAEGNDFIEYQMPLVAGGKPAGDLRIGLVRPSVWSTMQRAPALVPLALLPLLLIGAGAFVLSRLARSVDSIDSALRSIARRPLGAEIDLRRLRACDAASAGWNRLCDYVESLTRQNTGNGVLSSLERAAIERNDARLEEVLHRLADGVAVTDITGRIEFANRAIAALLGADAEEPLSGAVLEQRLLEMADNQLAEDLTSSSSRIRPIVCEIVHKDSCDERMLRVARLPLGSDAARGHVWSLRDVTQQRLSEQTRDRFIDTATHEMRTPLSNIKAYAETLATSDCVDVELQKEFCNIINSEVTRLARFIDDLLSISSMEVGALTITRAKVETERMFAEALVKVEPLMQQKSIDFDFSLPPKLPELHLDKDKIIAVLVNLLGNAAKYTPEGGRVSLKVKVEDNNLRIDVKDTGFGISAEEQDKVFEKFFRSNDTRVQAETGTGLGLSLAREIVRMHNGEILVESELNQGSQFSVILPLN